MSFYKFESVCDVRILVNHKLAEIRIHKHTNYIIIYLVIMGKIVDHFDVCDIVLGYIKFQCDSNLKNKNHCGKKKSSW